MPSDGIHTAFILQLMNGIADGFNGVSFGDNHPKRTPWTANSYHKDFFTHVRRQLKSIRFVDSKNRKPVKTDIPCLQNLIDTLQAFKLLWKKSQSLGFKSFDSRKINQDPLENFFGTIKSHDFRSNKPTCSQFEDIFKSLLISNLASKNSPGFNCESDTGQFFIPDCNVLLRGAEPLPNELDSDRCVQKEEEEQQYVIAGNRDEYLNEIPEKSNVFSNSDSLVKCLQRSVPAINTCSSCLKAFHKP